MQLHCASLRSPPFLQADTGTSSRRLRVVAEASPPGAAPAGRREAVLKGALLTTLLPPFLQTAAAEERPGKTKLNVKNLNSFQRNAERAAFLKIVEGELRKELKASDAPDTLRLVLHDAGSYDLQSETGGLNGSIVLDEELNRPENKDLQPLVARLKKIKANVDQITNKGGYGPISWADFEVVSAKVANQAAWGSIKRARGLPSSGDIVSSAFGASWPLKLGRIDTSTPDPPGRLPAPDATVAEITDYFARLNNRNYGASGFFAPRPIFDQRQTFILYGSSQTDVQAAEQKLAAEPSSQYKGLKKKYDQSRETVTRTDYEVDFIDYFNQLVNLGANFNPDAYLIPIEMDTPKL